MLEVTAGEFLRQHLAVFAWEMFLFPTTSPIH